MNIFASSPSPFASALNLDDKRALKMIVESAQIMSTALWLNGVPGPYKPTHKGHPCVKFVAANRFAYKWVFEHFTSLLVLYGLRYQKNHKCKEIYSALQAGINNIPSTYDELYDKLPDTFYSESELTNQIYRELKFPNCTTFKEETDIFLAYRKYMNQKWKNDKRSPKWTHTGAPDWITT